MDVSIVIVSWNVKEQLKKCIQSIYDHTDNLKFEIFVVDNDSKDNTAELIKNSFSSVNLIVNEVNRGFAYACNQAMLKSTGDFILLLNPDTELQTEAIEKMCDFMRNYGDCGIAGCKIINEDGSIQPSVRKFPDLVSQLFILLKLHNFFTNIKSVNNYYCKNFDYSKVQTVDQVMGAFYMIKRQLIKDIGLLDKHYFIWYEEVDFCKRAQSNFWSTYYNPAVEVLHQKGSSFSQVGALKKQYIFNRSMLYYFFKHTNIIQYLILLLIFPFSLLLAFIVRLTGFSKTRKDL